VTSASATSPLEQRRRRQFESDSTSRDVQDAQHSVHGRRFVPRRSVYADHQRKGGLHVRLHDVAGRAHHHGIRVVGYRKLGHRTGAEAPSNTTTSATVWLTGTQGVAANLITLSTGEKRVRWLLISTATLPAGCGERDSGTTGDGAAISAEASWHQRDRAVCGQQRRNLGTHEWRTDGKHPAGCSRWHGRDWRRIADRNSGTVVFGNGSGVTFGMDAGTITASVSSYAAAGLLALSDTATSISSGTVVLANSNGVSFGIDGQTLTASVGSGATATGNLGGSPR